MDKFITESVLKNLELNENMSSADVAAVDNKVELIETIFQNTIYEQVCDVQPTATPEGLVYCTTRPGTNGMGTKSVRFTVDEEKLPSRFSKEWFMDYVNQFGKNAVSKLKIYVSWDIKDITTQKFITMLNDIAEVQPSVVLTDSNDLQKEFFKIISAYNKAITKLAQDSQRGFAPYVICTRKVAAALGTIGQIKFTENNENITKELFGFYGNVKIFVDNYTTNEDYFIVGHHDFSLGGSTIIFCPYIVSDATLENYSVEESAVYVLSRYKLVRNPFDNTGTNDSKFAKKVTVDFSALTTF